VVLERFIDARFGLRSFLPGPDRVLHTTFELENTYNLVGIFTFTQQLNKTLGFVVELERESLSLNRIVTRATFDVGVVEIEAGPSLGLLNTEALGINPDLSLVLRLRFPSWNLSGLFRFDSALGRVPATPGDYTQSYVLAGLSYSFSWGKFTLGIFERSSNMMYNQENTQIGRWSRYYLAADFPAVPKSWGLRLELGYEHLQWNYELPISLEYLYGAVYAGLEGSFTVVPNFLSLIVGVEGPVYPFVYPTLIATFDDPQAAFYGRISFGFRLNL
jgi:hypothetical protein